MKEQLESNRPESIKKDVVFIKDTKVGKISCLKNILDIVISQISKKQVSRILIKPNLMDPIFSPGVTTSPEVLEYIAGRLRDRYEEVAIIEGGGFNLPAERTFIGHNVYDISKRTGATVFDLCNLESVFVHAKCRKNRIIQFPLPKIILDNENCIISLACLKTHVFTRVSLSIKNLWGCIPDRKRTLFHPYINEILAKIVTSIPNSIAIIDGAPGLNGRGPRLGMPIETNVLIYSDNLIAADVVAAQLMGFDPSEIEHIQATIREAEKSGFNREFLIESDMSPQFSFSMKTIRTWYDAIAILTYWSPFLSKFFYDSQMTPIIQTIVKRLGLSPSGENM